MAQPTRVLITDDSARARDGLRALFTMWPEIEVVGEACNGQDAVQLVAKYQPDVVVMDLYMPVLDGIQATQLIKHQWPAIVVVMLTLCAGDQSAAFAAGADAFLIKGTATELLWAALHMRIAEHRPSSLVTTQQELLTQPA